MEGSFSVTKHLVYIWNYLQGIKENYFVLREAKQENIRLKHELAVLKKKKVFYHELLLANQRLQSLLDLKKKLTHPSLGADVIGYTPLFSPRLIFLDRGRKDGLKLHFPVINIQGAIGQIAVLSPHYAKVLTIIDPNSRIGVMSQRTRINGIFVGTGINTGKIKYVMKSENVKVDDLFVTSGLDGIFPKGFSVGKVTTVSDPKTGLFKEIDLQTNVDFCRLEEVFILLKAPQWPFSNDQN
jgi:rod shape-determining protein MreC